MATRTFVALDLDDAVLRQLAAVQADLDTAGAKVRWTKPGLIHVTLKFLGGVIDEDLAEVCDLAAEVAAGIEPFDFDLAGVVSSPPHGHMRMVWANVTDSTGRMTELHNQLNELYAGMGYKAENRGFRPHLTIGRVKGGQRIPQLRQAISAMAEMDFGVQYADHLTVYSSKLRPEGPVYTAMATAELGAEAG